MLQIKRYKIKFEEWFSLSFVTGLHIFFTVLSSVCIGFAIFQFVLGKHLRSLLNGDDESKISEVQTICKTYKPGKLKVIAMRYQFDPGAYGYACAYTIITFWCGVITLLIGFVGLYLTRKRIDLASQWLKSLTLYPLMFFIFQILIYSFLGAIPQFISLFSSIFTVSATIKLWDESWKLWVLCRKESNKKLHNTTKTHSNAM